MDIAGWEQHYRTGARGSEDQPTKLLVETMDTLVAGNAIDLACGTGRNALYLAERRWTVTAIDASETAIRILEQRVRERGLTVATQVADLAAPDFTLPLEAFDLVVIAFYLQRDLYSKAKAAVRPGGIVLAIAHTPETGEKVSEKRVAPGELRQFFDDWDVLWEYEGPSRDPAHRRPVAEIVARRQ